jgi:hypothetical protein
MSSRPKRAAAPTSFKPLAQSDASSSRSSDDSGVSDSDSHSSDYKAPANDSEGDASDDNFHDLEEELDDTGEEHDGDDDEDDEDASASGGDSVDEDTQGVDGIAALLEEAASQREDYTLSTALCINDGALGSPSAVYRSACALRTLARAGALRDMLADTQNWSEDDVRTKFLNEMLKHKHALNALLVTANDALARRGRRLLALDMADTAEVWMHHLARTMPDAKRNTLALLDGVPSDVVRAAMGDGDPVLGACVSQFEVLLRVDADKEAVFLVRNALGATHTAVTAWIDTDALTWDDVAQMRKTLRVASGRSGSSIVRFGRKLRGDPPSAGNVVVKFFAAMPEAAGALKAGTVVVVEHMRPEDVFKSQAKLYDMLVASEFPEVRDVVQKIVESGLQELVPRGRNTFEFVTTAALEALKVMFTLRRSDKDDAVFSKSVKPQNVYSFLERNKTLVCDNLLYKSGANVIIEHNGAINAYGMGSAITDHRNNKHNGQPVTDAMRYERKELYYTKLVAKVHRFFAKRPAQQGVSVSVRTVSMPKRAKPTKPAAKLLRLD